MSTARRSTDPSVLVCDFSAEGHRGNYVRVLGQALGTPTLIASFRAAFWSVLFAQVVLFTTFETAPGPILSLMVLRAVLRRPTRVMLLRPVIEGRNWRARVKKAMQMSLVRLPGVRVITIMPLDPASHLYGRTFFVRDPEYWDADADESPDPTPLSEAIRAAAGERKIMIATGGIDPQKGMGLLADMMCAPDWPTGNLHVAIVGKTIGSGKADVDRIAAEGGFVEDRYLSDQELFSLYGIAACAWCCYPPDRDMSSGIFGRARQYGVWPVVREGSMLDSECRTGGFGTAIPWGQAERAATILAAMVENSAGMTMKRSGADAAHEIAQLSAIMFDASPPLAGR